MNFGYESVTRFYLFLRHGSSGSLPRCLCAIANHRPGWISSCVMNNSNRCWLASLGVNKNLLKTTLATSSKVGFVCQSTIVRIFDNPSLYNITLRPIITGQCINCIWNIFLNHCKFIIPHMINTHCTIVLWTYMYFNVSYCNIYAHMFIFFLGFNDDLCQYM